MRPPPSIETPDSADRDREAIARNTGKVGFVLRYGVVGTGVPLAVAADLLLLWSRGDMDLLLSPRHTFQLTFLLFLIAPVAGALYGSALWHRGGRGPGGRAASA